MPNEVTYLSESQETGTDFVSAIWNKPDGVVDAYDVACSEGTTPDYTEPEDGSPSYTATCSGLPTPGDTYTITVTSRSGDKRGVPTNVSITSCELIHQTFI